jgi:hypothetical protein
VSQRLTLVGGLFLVLLVLLVLLPPQHERQPPLTVYSAEPGGGKALRLWLEALGHPVTTLEGDRFTIGRDVSTVLLLSPSQRIGPAEQDELERWTRQGGRLVVATGELGGAGPIVGAGALESGELLSRFGVTVRPVLGVDQAVPAEAGQLDPAIQTVNTDAHLELKLDEAAGAVPLLVGQQAAADGHHPILAARVPADQGELIVLTAPSVLSNAGLHDEASARLAFSLIGPPGRGRVAFDELHHGFGSLQRRSMYALLLDQAWGRTAFLAGGIVLLFLLLRGRRQGRAVPVFVDRGRSLGELVTSQASLYRAGGKRAFVADHLARQLRHDLAQAVGLPADASDDEIGARASAMGRDPTRAPRVLAATRRAGSDRELLTLTREGAAARAALSRATSPPNPLSGAERGSRHAPSPPLRAGEGVGG